jgi:hypothetical protein
MNWTASYYRVINLHDPNYTNNTRTVWIKILKHFKQPQRLWRCYISHFCRTLTESNSHTPCCHPNEFHLLLLRYGNSLSYVLTVASSSLCLAYHKQESPTVYLQAPRCSRKGSQVFVIPQNFSPSPQLCHPCTGSNIHTRREQETFIKSS